jgi:hypothetical protein
MYRLLNRQDAHLCVLQAGIIVSERIGGHLFRHTLAIEMLGRIRYSFYTCLKTFDSTRSNHNPNASLSSRP